MTCEALVLTHLKGQLVRAAVTFAATVDGVDGVAVDPDTVRFKVKTPTPTTTTYTYGVDVSVIKDADGAYHLDFAATLAGTWYVRAEGTGEYQGAAEASFKVGAGNF